MWSFKSHHDRAEPDDKTAMRQRVKGAGREFEHYCFVACLPNSPLVSQIARGTMTVAAGSGVRWCHRTQAAVAYYATSSTIRCVFTTYTVCLHG
jgi:hypothetical protein